MNDPCKDPSLLSALVDGELSPAQQEEVRRHLDGCPACRQDLATLQRNDARLRQMPGLTPSADFNSTFWRKVEQLEARPGRTAWLRYLFSGWRPLVAGGLAGLAAAVFIAYGPYRALTQEEMFIADNIELLDDMDIVRHLDMLESWEALEAMEEQS